MVLPITSPVPSVIENDDTSLEDATVRPLVRSKKTFPNEGLSNSSATKSDAGNISNLNISDILNSRNDNNSN